MNLLRPLKAALAAFVCLAWLDSTMKLHASTVEYEGNGADTNGIYASVKYSHIPLKWDSDLIEISLHFSPPSTNIPFMLPHSATTYPFNAALYFSASNLFCGPIQLVDLAGNQIPLFKTNQNSKAAYPSQYSLTHALNEMNSGRIDWIEPVALTGNEVRFGNFNLPDTFKIEKPGNYQLTIWPKIYKRSETNRDIVQRIDLPPVTVPIHWAKNSTN